MRNMNIGVWVSLLGAFGIGLFIYHPIRAETKSSSPDAIVKSREIVGKESYSWSLRETKIDRAIRDEWNVIPHGADVYVVGRVEVTPLSDVPKGIAKVTATVTVFQGKTFDHDDVKSKGTLEDSYRIPQFRVLADGDKTKVEAVKGEKDTAMCSAMWRALYYSLPPGKGVAGATWIGVEDISYNSAKEEPQERTPTFVVCADYGIARIMPQNKEDRDIVNPTDGGASWKNLNRDVVAILSSQGGPGVMVQNLYLIERGTGELMFGRTVTITNDHGSIHTKIMTVARDFEPLTGH